MITYINYITLLLCYQADGPFKGIPICGVSCTFIFTPCTCTRGKACPAVVVVVVVVVVVGTKITRSRVLGICAYCKHNESRYLWKTGFYIYASNCWTWLTSATNCEFSVHHACGLPTTPTLLVCARADATWLRMLDFNAGKGHQVMKCTCSQGARPSTGREGLVHFTSQTCSSHPTGTLGHENHLEALLTHSVNHKLLGLWTNTANLWLTPT